MFKKWGKYTSQTVRQDKDNKSGLIIREGLNEIKINKNEVDSLIISLMRMK